MPRLSLAAAISGPMSASHISGVLKSGGSGSLGSGPQTPGNLSTGIQNRTPPSVPSLRLATGETRTGAKDQTLAGKTLPLLHPWLQDRRLWVIAAGAGALL